MTESTSDTIAAIATAPGTGAVAIVRVSGPLARSIAETVSGTMLRPRYAEFKTFRDAGGQRIDAGIVLLFPGPASYTGEDVVEFQVHGGAVVSEWLLETLFTAGARAAEPGEFTLRAFLNDKLDLAQAEAVADLVASHSRAGARAAGRSLDGRFSAQVAEIQNSLTKLRVQIEAHLDFPDEEIDPETSAALQARLRSAIEAVTTLQANAQQGVMLANGLSIAIAGPPNAGKSSVLNRLAGYDAAIVTDIPGTTRDPLREHILLDGLPIRIVDTAGLRVADDPIEREGLRRAHAEVDLADHIFWVSDVQHGVDAAMRALHEGLGSHERVSILLNKIDLIEPSGAIESVQVDTVFEIDGVQAIAISALTGAGFSTLDAHVQALAGRSEHIEGSFSARRRHLDAIERTLQQLEAASGQIADQPELAAEELRAAQRALSEVTGEFSSDDLLGEIFSSFCIGK